jgi:hypothetical protein
MVVQQCGVVHGNVKAIRCKRPANHFGQHKFRLRRIEKQLVAGEWARVRRFAVQVDRAQPVFCGHHKQGLDCPNHGACPAAMKKADDGWDAAQKAVAAQKEAKWAKAMKNLPQPIENASPIVQSISLELLNELNLLAEGKPTERFQKLGQGVSRIAYRIKGTSMVAKVETLKNTNKQEYKSWLKMTPQQRVLFAPVYWCSPDSKVLLMAYGAKNNDPELEQHVNWLNTAIETVGLKLGAQDVCPRNMGELDGRPVLIDYGFGAF